MPLKRTADSPPRAEVAHRLSGRVRLRFPGRRGDSRFFRALTERTARLAGVREARSNSLTGTLVLSFDAPLADVLAQAASEGVFVAEPGAPARRRAAPAVVVDNRLWAAAGLAGLGVFQALRGHLLGPAANLFWYAATLARKGVARRKDGQ